MKKLTAFIIIFALIIGIVPQFVCATDESKVVIKLNDNEIIVDGNNISSNKEEQVYLTNEMDNGSTSDEAKNENVKIDNIININKAGTYEFSGKLSNGQISINANNIEGNVKIILNNVDITCTEAPAIFVYSKDVENETCEVEISLADNSENIIKGGKLKVSVEEYEDQESIVYYVDKGYDDDKQYYERYKYDGAISSDISLTFSGNGLLKVDSDTKEGIETKMNVTINSGTYIVTSMDDGINACTEGKSVITINNGLVVVNIKDDAEEGDGIDSNGSIYINGGTVYSFAHPGSDNGIDSDKGVYINGGTVFSTGSMYESFTTENDTPIIQMQFSSNVKAGDSIVIVDGSNEPVFAYKADRNVSTIAYSSEKLANDLEYNVYTGTDIEGTVGDYNIYSEIKSVDLEVMTKQENTGRDMNRRDDISVEINKVESTEDNKSLAIIGGILVGIGILIAVMAVLGLTKKE